MTNKKDYILAAYSGDESVDHLSGDDLEKLTHINHFAAGLADGKIDEKSVGGLDDIEKLKNFDVDILISIGGWGVDGFSQAASTSRGRKRLAESIVNFVDKHNFDGIDLDWEYPGIPGGGIAASPDDKKNFTLLLKKIRQLLDDLEHKKNRHLLLTIAAGAYQKCAENMELEKITEKYLDFINLMTYDMGSSREITGHHTNLYAPEFAPDDYCVQKAVDIYKKRGVPSTKLVIGGAFYGHSWQGVENTNNGLNQPAETDGGTFHDFSEIVNEYMNKDQFNRYWDEKACAPYLFNGEKFLSYDDEESLREKVKFVKEKNLGGMMYFIHHADYKGLLLEALFDEFQK